MREEEKKAMNPFTKEELERLKEISYNTKHDRQPTISDAKFMLVLIKKLSVKYKASVIGFTKYVSNQK